MQELELTWKRIACIWWLMLWRGVIGGFLLGAVTGGIVGLIAGFVAAYVFHVPFDVSTYQQIGRLSSVTVCVPLGIVWGFLIVRMAIRKKYREFRIVLVPADSPVQTLVASNAAS